MSGRSALPAQGLPEPSPGRRWERVTDAASLIEGGDGVRFTWSGDAGQPLPAFVVRFDGIPRAYLNQCAHVPVELDWQAGRFFDAGGLYLVCATHGAMYNPDDGSCAGGPCRGRGLRALRVVEFEDGVWVEFEGVEDVQ